MNITKLLLWGGAGYLGYKLLSKDTSTFLPGDAAVQQLYTTALAVLDPTKKWTINVATNTGAVAIQSADGTINQVFVSVAAAQAWLNTMGAHGQFVDVTFNRI